MSIRRPVVEAERRAPPLRVAVLDNDSGFLTVLALRLDALCLEWWVLAEAASVDRLVAMRLHVLVMDPSLLGRDAWSYLEVICRRLPDLGVIVCTAPASLSDRVRGLRLGVDDWLAKPCHPDEVVARVVTVARRRTTAVSPLDRAPITAGELRVRSDHFQAYAAGTSVELTRREFELLELLAGAPGVVLQREEIYQEVWGYGMAPGDRSVDVYVRKLRRKLGRVSPGWRYIHTHFAVGYRFDLEPVAPPQDESALGARGTMHRRDERPEVINS
jgi:DNA-binding response OmpR family regulator